MREVTQISKKNITHENQTINYTEWEIVICQSDI